MASLRELLGPHAYMFQRYGISPEEDAEKAAERLKDKAPHIARLLYEISALF